MAIVNCTKSKNHGVYNTDKDKTCPWCDPPGIKSASAPVAQAPAKKRLKDMTEDEILEAKIAFGLDRILKHIPFGQKVQAAKDYKLIYKTYTGKDLDAEFEKENS